MRKFAAAFVIVLACSWVLVQAVTAGQKIMAAKVSRAPVIDGDGTDQVWTKAKKIITHDAVADIDITLKAVYIGKNIYFLVRYPDENESRSHKSWTWDKAIELYNQGTEREDVFVFKWNMGSKPVDLTLSSNNLYEADIWYWKATRTDPVGHADDKTHTIYDVHVKSSAELTSKTGTKRYLLRKADAGTAAYKSELLFQFEGYQQPRYTNVMPTGSRADVRAKGEWKKGEWTIEFKRPLKTGNDDDVPFDTKKAYQFGVSRYEIAGRIPNPELSQPLYGSGDIGEDLTLIFAR